MISTSREPYFSVPILDKSTACISAILYSVRDLEVSKILFVTDSGAGAPFARLYLIPKSLVGPVSPTQSRPSNGAADLDDYQRTTRVVAGSEEDPASGASLSDNMTCSRCAKNTILSDQ